MTPSCSTPAGAPLGRPRASTCRASPARAASSRDWLAEHRVALTGCDTWSYGPVPPEDPAAPVPGSADPQHRPRGLHRREPRPRAARRRRRAAVRADPHPSQAPRRHRRVDLPDRPRLNRRSDERALRRDHHRHRRRAAARSPTSWRRAASGSCCSSAAATFRASPRTGTAARSSARSATSSDELWYDKDGDPFKPHQQYFVGGNTKFYGAILFRLRERDFGEVRALRRHLAGLADLLRRPRALLRRGREALPRPRPGRARTRPSRGARARSRIRPSRTSRGSSSSPTTSSAPGTIRSTCRSGSTSTSPTPRPAAACAATASTASRA